MCANTKDEYARDVCLAILYTVTDDFSNDGDGSSKDVYGETDSFQVRPKVLYKNKLGIYFNLKGEGRVYLSKDDIDNIVLNNRQYERALTGKTGGIYW